MRDSQLSKQLTLFVASFIALFALFVGLSGYTLQQVRVMGPIYQQIDLGNDLIADVLPPPQYIIESYLIALQLKDETDLARRQSLIERGNALRVEYDSRQEFWKRELEPGPLDDVMTVTSARAAIDFFEVRDREFIPALQAGETARVAAALARMQQHYEAHRLGINEVVRLTTILNAEREASAIAVVSKQTGYLMVLAAFILLSVIVMAYLAARAVRNMSDRIRQASEIANRVAAGDLSTEMPRIDARDITGGLLSAIGTMSGNLRALVTRVKQASIELMSTATEFAATSRQQEQTVQGFGSSTNQIAAAVKQINSTHQELLATMEGVNAVAAQTADLAVGGQSGLSQLDQSMERLSSAGHTVAARLSAIRDEAAQINSVVTTISKVADQTNLLSINAAIEAEKAGEQGLGFLVLAREIRRLADQTAVATLDIEQMVKQMQGAVSAGVMEIDRFSEEVKSGIVSVGRINGQFNQIISQVRTLSERFDVVNDGMRSQNIGTRQIGEAMSQLIDGARQTSTSLREFNAATESLRDAVTTLKQEITQFNVGK
jgi:methyl-accepting chemotaxis protein WspA